METITSVVRPAIARGDLRAAERSASSYRDENGATPEALEALSWVARGFLNNRRFAKAADYAKEVHRLAVKQLPGTPLDSNAHLAAALGASIEVAAQVMARRKRGSEAVRFLKRELSRAGTAPIHPRIRKNLNLLTLTGQPAPELEIREWLGPKPPALADLRGRPVLLFCWAHYCEDSQAQGGVLVRIRNQFERRGLVLIGPTRRYGYLDEDKTQPAGPREEKQHIKQVLEAHYSQLSGMPVPISEQNFVIYGVSTTPTLVLIDPEGKVSLYHPGGMPYNDLAKHVRSVLINTSRRTALHTRQGERLSPPREAAPSR